MAADVVVPPSPPSNVFGVQGDSLHPLRGLRPLHPAWGDGGRHLLTLPRRDPLPRLPLPPRAEAGRFPRGEGVAFDCMLLSLSAGPRRVQARRRRGCVAQPSRIGRVLVADASRNCRGCVAYPSRSGIAPKRLSRNGIGSGPSLPRTVLPFGVFPQRPCHRGILCG